MPIRFNPDYPNKDLTCILKTNFSNSQELQKWLSEEILQKADIWILQKSFKQFILKEIAWKNIDKELLLWSLYVEKLLGKIFDPEFLNTFYAIDNLLKFEETQNPYYLQYWADIAFIRWSIFPGKQKMIRKKDYLDIAKHLYYSRYKHTANLIWEILYWNLEFYAQKLEKFLKM